MGRCERCHVRIPGGSWCKECHKQVVAAMRREVSPGKNPEHSEAKERESKGRGRFTTDVSFGGM